MLQNITIIITVVAMKSGIDIAVKSDAILWRISPKNTYAGPTSPKSGNRRKDKRYVI